jgi:hypothetical protein
MLLFTTFFPTCHRIRNVETLVEYFSPILVTNNNNLPSVVRALLTCSSSLPCWVCVCVCCEYAYFRPGQYIREDGLGTKRLCRAGTISFTATNLCSWYGGPVQLGAVTGYPGRAGSINTPSGCVWTFRAGSFSNCGRTHKKGETLQ